MYNDMHGDMCDQVVAHAGRSMLDRLSFWRGMTARAGKDAHTWDWVLCWARC